MATGSLTGEAFRATMKDLFEGTVPLSSSTGTDAYFFPYALDIRLPFHTIFNGLQHAIESFPEWKPFLVQLRGVCKVPATCELKEIVLHNLMQDHEKHQRMYVHRFNVDIVDWRWWLLEELLRPLALIWDFPSVLGCWRVPAESQRGSGDDRSRAVQELPATRGNDRPRLHGHWRRGQRVGRLRVPRTHTGIGSSPRQKAEAHAGGNWQTRRQVPMDGPLCCATGHGPHLRHGEQRGTRQLSGVPGLLFSMAG